MKTEANSMEQGDFPDMSEHRKRPCVPIKTETKDCIRLNKLERFVCFMIK